MPTETPQPTRASPRQLELWGLVLVLAAGVLLVGSHVLLDATATWTQNAPRLQRSFALAAGFPLYPTPGEGLSLLSIYGPVGAIAYLPATLARTPTAAIVAGQLLAAAFFFLPILWLHLRGRDPAQRPLAWLAWLLFAVLAIDLRALEYPAFTIHADAPALALGALACAALTGRRDSRALWLAALATVLALWSKQVMVTLVPALFLYLGLAGGWGAVGRFFLRLAAASAASVAMVVLLFGPFENLWFHLVTVLTTHGWQWNGAMASVLHASGLLLAENTVLWALLLAAAALALERWRHHREPLRAWLDHNPWAIFWLAGLCALPMGILGRAKVGGDANAFSYVVYYLLVGLTLALLDLATRAPAGESPWATWSRRVLVAGAVFVLAVLVLVQEPGCLTSWRGRSFERLPHEIAYRYARNHPGEVYFPRLTLATTLAEGRFYHQEDGLWNLQSVGMELSVDDLRDHLPPNLRAVAWFRDGYQLATEGFAPLPGLVAAPDDAELPGFDVYTLGP